MTRRFQFSIATLLLGTAVAAVATAAVNWWMLRQRMVSARDRFTEQMASYEVGTATSQGVILASKELLQAELAMPIIPSDQLAWLSYLDRTRHLHRKTHAMANIALFGSMEAMVRTQRTADALLDECHRVEDRLALPHVDNEYFRSEDGHYAYENYRDEESVSDGDVAPPAPDIDQVEN